MGIEDLLVIAAFVSGISFATTGAVAAFHVARYYARENREREARRQAGTAVTMGELTEAITSAVRASGRAGESRALAEPRGTPAFGVEPTPEGARSGGARVRSAG